MDEESKQYTVFTLGSMGLYECESMPFGLCNALPAFQRLMQKNLTYCLIYLDDVIVSGLRSPLRTWPQNEAVQV